MKKFTKLLICFMLCLFGVFISACDNRTPEEKAFTYPKKSDQVYGNGGMAVRKGNYVYFVNGYMGVDDEDHKQGKSVTHGSLMLMKLDADGNVVTDENGLLDDDYYISMSSKLCGYEATNLFISGNYLYFTSPCQENKGGQGASGDNKTWAKEYVEFYRIKLDKTSSVEEIYQSKISYKNFEFKYYEQDGEVFVLAYENSTRENSTKSNTLIRIKCSNKSATELETGITSVIMAEDGKSIVYAKSGDNGVVINKYNVFTNATQHIDTIKSADFGALKLVSDSYVYITDENDELMRRRLNANESWEELHEYVGHYDKLMIIPHGDKIIAIKNNRIKILNSTGESYVDEDTEKVNFIGFNNGSVVYYDDDKNVKTLAYNTTDASIITIATVEDMSTNYFDMANDDTFMYFYKTVGSNEYLFRLEVAFGTESEEEMFGVYLEDDAPEIETEDSEDVE
ncbi:MAG: hypothetical protein ACLRFL_00750 [Clostridia bacterium]